MYNAKMILIIQHIGYAICDLQSDIFEGSNCNAKMRYLGIDYTGLKGACGKRHAVYMYSHTGQTVSLSPFSCPFDSGIVGYIWTNSDRLAESLVKELDAVLRNDWYVLTDKESNAVFEGSYSDCIQYAKDNNAEMREQD